MRARIGFIAALAVLYAAVLVVLDGLRFEPRRDEIFFWPTVVRFGEALFSDPASLRDYQQFLTPFAFAFFGALEHVTGGGIVLARGVNLAASFAIAVFVGWPRRGEGARPLAAAAGLLLFPYFLATAAHLYTDVLAAGFVLAGVAAQRAGRPVAASVGFVLAIATRQFAVAFPLGVALWEWRRGGTRTAVALPLAAAATLVGWVWLFGGLAPPSALSQQPLAAFGLLPTVPGYAVYFLACVGLYYAGVERGLAATGTDLAPSPPARGPMVACIALLAVITWWFPPLGNVDYPIETMGWLDRAARTVLGDGPRVVVFFGLAAFAAGRFARTDLASLLVWTNALCMLQAQVAWDKYALPLLVVLWYLAARGDGALSSTSGRSGAGERAAGRSP